MASADPAAEQALRPSRPQPSLGGLLDVALSRVLPAAFFGFFFLMKLVLVYRAAGAVAAGSTGAGGWLSLVNQCLGLAYFGLLALMMLIRLPRLSGRRGLGTFALAMFSSFALMFVGVLPDRHPHPQTDLAASLLNGAGLAYSVWAILYLQRSFSILPEARRLVTGGPYGLSRHPLYLGEGAATLGFVIPVAGPLAVLLCGASLVTQIVRIHWEETVLGSEFPDYAQYAKRVPRYLPFLF